MSDGNENNSHERVLGETNARIEFSTRAENRELAIAMAQQARRSIELFTPDLEAPVYDNAEFLEAVRQLALRSRSTSIRVLIQDSAHVMKHGHRLVELARSYSSAIQLHKPPPEYSNVAEGFLVVDGTGYIHKQFCARYEGIADFHDPFQSRTLIKLFDEMWERSHVDPELRRLHI